LPGFLALAPLILFDCVGFELQNGAAEEMVNPKRDVPVSVLRSGTIGVILSRVPVFGILLVLPAPKITGGHRRRRRRGPAWAALGAWVAVFSGTLEPLFGVAYDFRGTWGVSRLAFHGLTLGTLTIVLLVAIAGYPSGRRAREHDVVVPVGDEGVAPAAT